jgi:hypothetical protein
MQDMHWLPKPRAIFFEKAGFHRRGVDAHFLAPSRITSPMSQGPDASTHGEG